MSNWVELSWLIPLRRRLVYPNSCQYKHQVYNDYVIYVNISTMEMVPYRHVGIVYCDGFITIFTNTKMYMCFFSRRSF